MSAVYAAATLSLVLALFAPALAAEEVPALPELARRYLAHGCPREADLALERAFQDGDVAWVSDQVVPLLLRRWQEADRVSAEVARWEARLAAAPDDPKLLDLLGRADRILLDQPERAAERLHRRLRLPPWDEAGFQWLLGRARQQGQAVDELLALKWRQSGKAGDRASVAQVWVEELARQAALEASMAVWEQALASGQDPEELLHLYLLREGVRRRQSAPEAEEERFSLRVLERDPEAFPVYRELAFRLRTRGAWQELRDLARSVCARTGDETLRQEAALDAVRAWLQLDPTQSIVTELKQSLADHPQDPLTLALALAFHRLPELDISAEEKLAIAELVAAARPTDLAAWRRVAELYAKVPPRPEAVAVLLAIRERFPTEAIWTGLELALCHERLGEPDQALAWADVARREAHPWDLAVFVRLSMIYRLRGLEAGRAALEEELRGTSAPADQAEVLYNTAYQLQQGEPPVEVLDEALALLQRTRTLEPYPALPDLVRKSIVPFGQRIERLRYPELRSMRLGRGYQAHGFSRLAIPAFAQAFQLAVTPEARRQAATELLASYWATLAAGDRGVQCPHQAEALALVEADPRGTTPGEVRSIVLLLLHLDALERAEALACKGLDLAPDPNTPGPSSKEEQARSTLVQVWGKRGVLEERIQGLLDGPLTDRRTFALLTDALGQLPPTGHVYTEFLDQGLEVIRDQLGRDHDLDSAWIVLLRRTREPWAGTTPEDGLGLWSRLWAAVRDNGQKRFCAQGALDLLEATDREARLGRLRERFDQGETLVGFELALLHEALPSGDPQELSLLTAYLDASPFDAGALFRLHRLILDPAVLERSTRRTLAAMALDPDHPNRDPLVDTLTEAWRRADWTAGARQVLEEVIQGNPQDLEARRLLARLLLVTRPREDARAMDILESLVLERPYDIYDIPLLDRLYDRAGEPGRAVAFWRRLLESVGKDISGLVRKELSRSLCEHLLRSGRVDEARTAANDLFLPCFQDELKGVGGLLDVAYQTGHPEFAVSYVSDWLDGTADRELRAHRALGLGRTLMDLGDTDHAAARFRYAADEVWSAPADVKAARKYLVK